jgi:cell division protein FtsI/penicillin-binding protein 2
MTAAAAALGQQLGGIAVIRPRDGAVQALAGLAVSAPQPPGSTFKIITLSAALQNQIATPSSNYPIRTSATLSGVELRNAGGEACGGSLTEAFTVSCNSVFAPLGAKLGARRLVQMARAFGFYQHATIALDGHRVQPRITTLDPVISEQVITPKVAHQVRSMMIQVVRSGTGTAAAIPGVQVAGKTGTAELRPNSSNPKDSDAWFVAFAPAQHPKVAVAIMLVGAGFGGTSAAPIARHIMQTALAPS